MALSIFTSLSSHHHHPSPEIFLSCNTEALYPLISNSSSPWQPAFLFLSLWIWPLLVFVVQSLSRVWLSVTPWTAAHQASLSFTISRSLLKLRSTESVMPLNHLILHHLFLPLPSIFPSIRVFSNESALSIRWPKCWSFSISPSNEYSGWISFKIDWFDLLVA